MRKYIVSQLKETKKPLIMFLVLLLAACSSDDQPKADEVVSGVIKVEVTYPENFMEYELEVTLANATYDVTKINTEDIKFDYLNDPDFVAVDDPDSFPLVSGNTKHVFQTANYSLGLGMLLSSNNTDANVEEGINVNFKIFLNNTLQEDIDLVTERGGFDFTWTPKGFLYDAN